MTTAPAKPIPFQMLDLITGYWLSCGVHVAARLSLADHLAKGPRTSADLAKACQAHPPTLYRLLRMLATSLSERGHHLRRRREAERRHTIHVLVLIPKVQH